MNKRIIHPPIHAPTDVESREDKQSMQLLKTSITTSAFITSQYTPQQFEYAENNYDVSDVTDRIIIGEQPHFLLEQLAAADEEFPTNVLQGQRAGQIFIEIRAYSCSKLVTDIVSRLA